MNSRCSFGKKLIEQWVYKKREKAALYTNQCRDDMFIWSADVIHDLSMEETRDQYAVESEVDQNDAKCREMVSSYQSIEQQKVCEIKRRKNDKARGRKQSITVERAHFANENQTQQSPHEVTNGECMRHTY